MKLSPVPTLHFEEQVSCPVPVSCTGPARTHAQSQLMRAYPFLAVLE